jgi:hypothetical protein
MLAAPFIYAIRQLIRGAPAPDLDPGQCFNTSRSHILYGEGSEPELKIIDVFICKLHKKLAQAIDGSHYIETVWGRGYILREPPT